MAIFITEVQTQEVPDDRAPEVIARSRMPRGEVDMAGTMDAIPIERCQPFNVYHFKPYTPEEALDPYFMPERERYVIYMSKDIQKSMGLLYKTWSWLNEQYTVKTEQIQQLERMSDRHHEYLALLSGEPWYKRVWRALKND